MTIPFCPSIYEHAAKLIEASPWRASRDIDLVVAGHIKAYELYHHSPIVIGIDIYNLEAEAYGAVVDEPSADGIPAIHKHPFSTTTQLLELQPFDPKTAGRVPMIIEAAKQVAAALPDADVRVPLAGPFSVATNLMGFDNLLLEIATTPHAVADALMHLVQGQLVFCKAIVDNGLDIAFFESAAAPPLLSPAQFRDIELPALKSIMQHAATLAGHAMPCIIGGNTLPILDSMLDTGAAYICCPVATDQQAFMEKMLEHPQVTVRINMNPAPMTAKNLPAIQKEVDRVLALPQNNPHVCIGTGCLPYETDPEMVLETGRYIRSRTQKD